MGGVRWGHRGWFTGVWLLSVEASECWSGSFRGLRGVVAGLGVSEVAVRVLVIQFNLKEPLRDPSINGTPAEPLKKF